MWYNCRHNERNFFVFRVAVAVCCGAVLSFAYGNPDAGAYEIGEDIAALVDNWVRIIAKQGISSVSSCVGARG